MNEKGDCIHYSEVQDMNATVPCCDFYEFGNTPCKDCKRYYSKKDLVAIVRCEDCKKFRNNLCRKFMVSTELTDYCSYGERKETE